MALAYIDYGNMLKIKSAFFIACTGMLVAICMLVEAYSAEALNEAQALMAFKAGITRDPLGRLQSWQLPASTSNDSSTLTSPCRVEDAADSAPLPVWAGITCDTRRELVTSVDLRSFNLSGTVSSSLSFLSALFYLDLSDNFLSGTLSDALFSSHSPIQYLNLSHNLLQGGLPDSLTNLSTSLRTLDLSYNNFEAQMPPSLGQLRDLKVLILEETGFSGDVPEGIWQLPSLSELRIVDDPLNLLHIALPESLGFCGTITDLILTGAAPSAQGTANISSSLSDCHKLENLIIDVENLQGLIAPQIWQLPMLHVLVVADVSLSGNLKSSEPLPDSFASCPTISQLALVGINLAGSSIPSSLGACHRLEVLEFYVFGLQGSIPSQIWQLPLLQTLIVVDEEALQNSSGSQDRVQFNINGTLPSNFSFCSSIEILELDGVGLTGEVPASLGACTSLKTLDLSRSSLEGAIPDSLQNLTNLKILYLHSNYLTGKIPTSLSACSQLQLLSLSDNEFHGPIPPTLANCTALKNLDLRRNFLDGEIPSSLSQLTGLTQGFLLASNNLSGEIPEALGALTQVQVLDLSRNNLLGAVPKSLENCSSLQTLRLFNNGLTGEIEQFNLTKLPQLQTFTVYQNSLTGGLPSSFTSSPQLVLFDVQKNGLSGSLTFFSKTPDQIVMGLSNLRVLVLSYNNLSSALPGWLWRLPALQVLDLSNNHFTGNMPTAVSGLANFMKNQGQRKNQSTLYEEVPQTIKFTFQVLSYILNTRVYLDVSNNRLEGEIADSFGDLLGLTGLNLSQNHIQGRIPPSLGNLVNLDVLDVSHNNVTGAIPLELGNLGGLSVVDLSYNNLEGSIPDTNFFNTRFGSDSFAHNPLLCGVPLQRNCSINGQVQGSTNTNLEAGPTQNLAEQRVERIEDFLSLWGLLIGYVIGLLGVLYLLHCV